MDNRSIKYEFSDLCHLKNDELRENVPIKDLIFIITPYINNADIPKTEILRKCLSFVCQKLLPTFGLEEDLITFLDDYFPKLFDIFEIVIDSISTNVRTIEDSNILEVLSDWHSIFEIIGQEAALNLRTLSVFIEFGLKFLEKYFSLVQDLKSQEDVSDEKKESLEKILQESYILHSQIINTLENNIELDKLICRSTEVSARFTFLIELLRITETLFAICDVVSSTKTLKLLLKLSVVNADFFENQLPRNYTWLENTIKFLCGQIHLILLQFYKEEFKDELLSDITKYMKVCSFHLKCINKIADNYSSRNVCGYGSIIPVFFEIFRLTTIIGAEVFQLITEYLIQHILSLIQKTFIAKDFVEEYLKKFHDSRDDSAYCIIGLEIIQGLAITKDEYDISIYFFGHFFENFFSKIPNCPDIFLFKENYQKLEASFISLMFFCNENDDVYKKDKFEKILVDGILQYDLLLSRICFDIWVFLARHVDSECCYHYFDFWTKITEYFPVNCCDPKTVQIKYLVKIFYEHLPKSYKIKVWNRLSLDETGLTSILGVNQICDEARKNDFKNTKLEKLIENIKIVIEEDEVENEVYMNLINLFNLLSDCQINLTRFPGLMTNFMKIICFETDFKKHEYFFNVVLKFLLKNFECFDDSEKTIICNLIESLMEHPINVSTKLYVNKFKKVAAQENILMNFNSEEKETIDEFLDHLMNSETMFENEKFNLVKLFKMYEKCNYLTLWSCKDFIKNDKINSQEYNIEAHPSKKIKLNDVDQICDDYQLVQITFNNAKQISNYYKSNSISTRDINTLKEIISLFTEVVNVSIK